MQLNEALLNYERKDICQKDIEFTIVKIKLSAIYNYSGFTLLLNNEINDQFITKPIYLVKENDKIRVNINDIIFRTFEGKLYFEIKKMDINKNKSTIINEYNNNNFMHYNYLNNVSELKHINNDSLVSIPVKIEEKEDITGGQYIFFKDMNKEQLIIKYDKGKFDLEGQKIYLLEGFLLDYNENKLYQLPNSNVTEIIDVLDKNKNIEKSEIPGLFNFKGKIKTFDFIKKVIIIENEGDNNKYEVEIDNILFSKISINTDCYFYNFSKINDKKYK